MLFLASVVLLFACSYHAPIAQQENYVSNTAFVPTQEVLLLRDSPISQVNEETATPPALRATSETIAEIQPTRSVPLRRRKIIEGQPKNLPWCDPTMMALSFYADAGVGRVFRYILLENISDTDCLFPKYPRTELLNYNYNANTAIRFSSYCWSCTDGRSLTREQIAENFARAEKTALVVRSGKLVGSELQNATLCSIPGEQGLIIRMYFPRPVNHFDVDMGQYSTRKDYPHCGDWNISEFYLLP
jgi:hypothetical protein